jgi:cytochrome c
MRLSTLAPTLLLAACGLGHAADAPASVGLDLAKASGCLSCHAMAEKIVGPAFQDVASKYAGEKDAAATLAQSIRNGSSGKWSKRIPMPPHPNLSNADLATLSKWVLAQK